MALPVGTDCVQENVGRVRSPQRVWLDEPVPSLVAEIDEQAVHGSEPDGLDSAAQSRCPECWRWYPGLFFAVKGNGLRYVLGIHTVEPGEDQGYFGPELIEVR